MRRLGRQSGRQKGFTLLELLVVVIIVAILFTYTTLAIRSDSPEDLIKKEAIRLKHLVELALEESILRGEEHALEIHQDGYLFLRYTQNQWAPVAGDKVLQQRELPLDMELEMRLEETEIVIDPGSESRSATDKADADVKSSNNNEAGDEETSYKPQIYLLSSGEITPEFDIRFYILGVETSYIVKGLFDGTVSSEQSEL